MRCLFGAVSKRARLKVRLENRLQYELERPLRHPVPNGRNRKDADLAPILRYCLPSRRKRFVGAPDQFVPDLLEQSVRALRFDGLEGNPIYSRGSIVLFGHLIRFAQRLRLADVDVKTPETPGRFSLRLDIYPPPQVLQIDGRLYHLVLAFPWSESLQMAGPIRQMIVTPLRRYCGPSRHPLVFGRLPGFAGYTTYLAPV